MKKIIISVFIGFIIILIALIISYFRYDIFSSQNIQVNRYLRILEMSNSIFHPFLKNGSMVDYYDDERNIVKGRTIFENGNLVKRISYFQNGKVFSETPVYCCSLHGLVTQYFDNAEVKFSTNFLYGIIDGKAVEYFRSGKIKKEFNFKNGLRQGVYLEYDSLGLVIHNYKFQNGKLIE